MMQDRNGRLWLEIASKNCHSGEFLDSDLQYIHINNITEVWCSNGTVLRTAPRSDGPSQRWVYGPEEFHGGKVLRHYMDGRGVDVHGWRFKDGGNVGEEHGKGLVTSQEEE